MYDFRPILLVIGVLLTILAVAMCIPAGVDLYYGNPDWQVFVLSAGCTLFVGVILILSCRGFRGKFGVRQGFIMTTAIWVSMTVFGALPLVFSELNLSITDAFFEAMSGITTTGSTVISGLNGAPPGLLLWRAILQWLGGIGIIVMAISILPMLKVGGMQLFRVEAFDAEEKVLPRAAQMSAGLTLIYVALTAICAVALWLAGLRPFDAITHSMTTIATGGFSTYDASVGHFNSGMVDAIITIGMIIGSLPFLLYVRTIRGDVGALYHDSQVQVFLAVAASFVLVAAAFLWIGQSMHPLEALRHSAFNVVSIMTGTGFATMDYMLWGSFAAPLFFMVMFIGGCAGSTTCGIKIFRFQVVYAAARTQLRQLLQPHGVFIPYYNRRPIPDEVIVSVLGFFFLFGVTFALLALGLGMFGLDFITALSSAATAIANVGPGLGDVVGPAGNFQSLPDGAKWLMAVGMLLGRLELFTVLVLLTRSFWRG
ncbi:MAG: TrkH family potassium uptake protein [Rhodospirillales bacterium]|nr:TrkH family potassium uptake protein [Rhodospirillales bacterium]MCW8952387.1 TrkH family potassium uptake protein [Rhodospirillales bacterium]MCW8970683.1 TrkH family potassium uptake protein [Rhodospirillales bacterium]MCW9002031.1 TrkH family potassium uptake protein [Rhodospirillales bacterium]MCW9040798.1 TrkH family potassium uptake protein [Rhodospirillales bacterium]